MADSDSKSTRISNSEGWQVSEGDALDRELDAALARYAAVEPRAGLEGRVLANLRAERERYVAGAWPRWLAVATVAAGLVMVVALSLAWRHRDHTPVLAHRPPVTTHGTQPHGMQVANRSESYQAHPDSTRNLVKHAGHRPQTESTQTVTAQPRLEQFPSPRPLSEQEKILASYIADYPEHAALIAQARAEAVRRDQTEEAGVVVVPGKQDSQQQSR